MIFKTVSGSTYEIQGGKVRRVNEGYGKRADGEWVELINPNVVVEVGEPVILHMTSLSYYGPDDEGRTDGSEHTTRITSTVKEIWHENR